MQLGFLHHLNARVGLRLDDWVRPIRRRGFRLGGDIDQGMRSPRVEPGTSPTVNTVLLNYGYRPYRGHTASVGMTYGF